VHFHLTWELGAFCVFAAGLVALTAIDLRTKRLPREITYTTLAVGAPLLVVAALVRHQPVRIGQTALGAAIALLIMLAVYLASRGGMGDGDVRLSPLLGAYLGWLNPGIVPVGLLFGFFGGAVVGVVLLAVGRAGPQDGAAVRAVPRARRDRGGLRRPAVRRRGLGAGR